MINASARQTKIIWSFEGSHCADMAKKISKEDVDVLRIVYERDHAKQIAGFIKEYRSPANLKQAPIMMDISTWSQGEISSHNENLKLNFGDNFTLSEKSGSGQVEIETYSWERLFAKNSVVYFGFGQLVAKINNLTSDLAEMEVLQGGYIHKGMDVYVPDTRIQTSLKYIRDDDLKAFADCPVDYIVIPGKWTSSDIIDFKKQLAGITKDITPWLIVKIDSNTAYRGLSDVMPHVDGVMISRRELSLTMNPATIPMITKEIIQLCNEEAKIVLTASEMLSSMRFNGSPTRAEVSDVANAVIDGTDAVILSEEVSEGDYGAKALEIMNSVIVDIEAQNHVGTNWSKKTPSINNEMDAITFNAYKTAQRVGAKAIVCITKDGNTAIRLASFRVPVPVIAVTFSSETRDKLRVVRGVQTLYLDMEPNIDNVLPTVNDFLLKESWLKKGDNIIFVAVTLSSLSEEASNLFTIQKLS
jgi:pyruvate kinase